MTKVNLFWLCQSNCGRSQPQTRVMRITHNVALNFHPIFIPLNQLFGAILDFEFWIVDLLYRFALSFFIKLTKFLKSKI
jgi:hypothetical protein